MRPLPDRFCTYGISESMFSWKILEAKSIEGRPLPLPVCALPFLLGFYFIYSWFISDLFGEIVYSSVIVSSGLIESGSYSCTGCDG